MFHLLTKRRIRIYVFIFYFATGLLPLLILSYYYLGNYAKSLRTELNYTVNAAIGDISTSVHEKIENTKKMLFAMSQLSTLKAGMTEYLTPLKRESIRRRLNELTIFFGFNYFQVIRNDGEVLFSNLKEKNEKLLVFEENIFSYSNDKLGKLIIYVEFEKLFARFLEFKKKGYNFNKQIYYRGEKIYDESKVFKNPIEFKSGKDYEFVLISQISGESLKRKLKNSIQNTVVLILLFVIASILISIYFLEWLTRPFGILISGFENVAEGDFGYRIKKYHSKDIDYVYEQFNKMVQKLSDTQDKLIQAEKLSSLGIMSAGVAHEIKNPLASIKMAIEHIKRADKSNTDEIVKIIEEETERINRFVNHMLNFSKPSVPKTEPLNIKKEVQECIKLLSFQIKKAKVSVKENLSDYNCRADKNHLHQIIINLLINAIQACQDGGQIVVESEIISGIYTLKISDSGKGIPKEVYDEIFDPFFTTKKSGSGLGLSVVYSLCKKNNIDLHIESEDNVGTTVILKFQSCV